MQDLIDVAQAACDAAVRAGADFADVSAYAGEHRSVDLELGLVKEISAQTYSGLSVRAYRRGACAWASASTLARDEAVSAGESAARLAAIGDPDPDFRELPEGGSDVTIAGLYDERVAGLTIEDLMAYLLPEVEGALAVAPEATIMGGTSCGWGRNALVSSRGFTVERIGSSVSCYVNAVIRHGDDVGSFGDYDFGRTLDAFVAAGLGRKAAEGALQYLGARHIASGEFPIVFGFRAAPGILTMLASHANAEDIQRKRSYLVGKRGEAVASPAVTLVDDPFIPGGGSSSPTDGEGVPHKKLALVEGGVLKTYLHNSYTAGKGGETNTAHSTRGGISPTNCSPVPGTRPLAELIAEVKEGVFVDLGHLSVNRTTGDFSQVLDFGMKIENGELAYPVKETMISGSYLDFLANVDAVSSDYREEPGSVMPGMRVQRVRVVGR
jgi:PmbA protein